MNFYFNYFTFIGREQSICHLSSVCLFLKKVKFPFPPSRSVKSK